MKCLFFVGYGYGYTATATATYKNYFFYQCKPFFIWALRALKCFHQYLLICSLEYTSLINQTMIGIRLKVTSRYDY